MVAAFNHNIVDMSREWMRTTSGEFARNFRRTSNRRNETSFSQEWLLATITGTECLRIWHAPVPLPIA